MKESYPYIVLPQKVEKIMSEGIPLPPLPQLLPLPEAAKRKYIGTIIFVVSIITFIILILYGKRTFFYNLIFFISFFIALISLVASIFEFVQYGKLKKQYLLDVKLYNENKEAFKKIKANQEKIILNNNDEKLVKKYRLDKITEFFSSSYDLINAIHNEYSLAKKRYKLFIEEYFPDEVLDNIRITHSAKNLEFIPDFVIKFAKPKLNVAIEIEEPYTLSNVPENIQKDYDAKDRIRQRFANELGWFVIVLSEEQAVRYPIECCKFIEESIESVFGDIKLGDQFAKVQPIKKQKMLTGEERAHLKSTGYREKYLAEAGLLEHPDQKDKYDDSKKEDEKKVISQILKDHSIKRENEKPEKIDKVAKSEKVDNDEIPESNYSINDMKTPDKKKEPIENEQLMLIKKLAQKVKPENGQDETKEEQEPIKYKSEKGIVISNDIDQDKLDKKEQEISQLDNVQKSGIKQENKIEEVKEVQTKLEKVLIQESKQKNISEIKNEVEEEIDEEAEKEIVEEIVEEIKEVKGEIVSIQDSNVDVSKKAEQLQRENDILKDLYAALDRHTKKQQERKANKLKEQLGKKDDLKVVEETKIEKLVKKDEKTAQNEQNIEEITSSLISNMKTPEKIQLEEKLKQKETIEKAGEKEIPINQNETIFEVSKLENQKDETKPVDINEEEMDAKKLLEERQKTEKLHAKEAEKNQKIIDEYREKIEGAVFDKAWDDLINLCNEAIKVVPFWDWAYYRRSTAYGNKRDFEKVIEDCSKAVGFNPSLADAYYNRATARFFTARYREALEDYQKAIDLNYVKKADAYFNKGLSYQKLELHKKAYLEFMKAKEMGSKKAEEIIKSQYE